MADATEQPAATETPAVELNAQEQAAVEVGQRGFSEPTNVNTPAPSGPQRPEGVPEQFWKDGKVDVEGLAKSYGELRSKMDSKSTEEAPANKEETPPVDATGKIKPEEKKEEVAEGEPTPLQTAMEAARTQWAETQEVSDETVAQLEAAGIPKDVFSLYLEGLKAQTAQLVSSIHEIAGGKEQYEAATAWAAKTLKADEVAAFNDALDNPTLRETAITGLMARYQKAIPSEGRQVTPTDMPAAGSDVFASRDELVAAQKDPRYATDAKYREEVAQKLARSQAGGFQAFARPQFGRQILSS
jgi:hypothetical protein